MSGAASYDGADFGGQLRRTPTTPESERRVDSILDAAAAAVESLGSTRVTTTEIAARAQVPVGAVYYFFSDRIAVLIALSLRNQTRLRARFVDAFGEQPTDLDDATKVLFATLVEHYRDEPSVRSLGTGDWIDLGPHSPRSSCGTIAAPAVDAIAGLYDVPHALAYAGIETVCAVTDALLQVAFRDYRSGEPALLLQARAACNDALRRALR